MTAIDWQLTYDASDPHAQADFWAAALGYEVENNADLVQRMLDAGYARGEDTTVHNGLLAWRELEAVRGAGRRILFQRVPEHKTVKNRVHVDLNVGGQRLSEEVARLVGLGARQVSEVNDRGSHHFVLQDPEGNEFCVQ